MPDRIQTQAILAAALALILTAAALPSAPLAAQSKAKPRTAEASDPYSGLSLNAFKLRSIGPALTSGRIGLALSPVVSDLLYAIVEAQEDKGGFYRSTNGGASWERRSSYTSSGNYYQEILCDPKDPGRVYSHDVFLQVTDDGGATWKALGDQSKHWDSHALWIDPDDTDYYLNGNDSGVYESFDRGKTWKYMPNLPVTKFYKVTIDNDAPFYNVYGGT